MRQDKFGKSPSGARLERIKQSPNYKNGQFQNISKTTTLAEGHNYFDVLYESYIKRKPRKYPSGKIPSVKTDLLNLAADEDILVWFGHSSYFMQIDGKRILVDPVFSGNASPIPGTVKSFDGTDVYTVADLPDIDYLFISHDHYDHVDYETLIALKEKTRKVICGLGVGAHFEHWGYNSDNILEGDWGDKIALDNGFVAFVETARHFSGRGFSTNNTLWASYVLQTPTMKIYIGGDSGYDRHYVEIGKKYGSFDLAILDNGQYDEAWKYIHHLPEDVLKASRDLNAKRILPVHSSKFVLGSHDWDEPLAKIIELNQSYNIPLLTPMIGEAVQLKSNQQKFSAWWLEVK
ncbi:MBL fold metallo-hydrolase [Sphingobacterium corticis]|uniref:MBL fold metallo-hydrolase n=1 Tax=Sphingobacterium corticis TaxID=1812823 RepID=A0ABW5NFA9_9SPHI